MQQRGIPRGPGFCRRLGSILKFMATTDLDHGEHAFIAAPPAPGAHGRPEQAATISPRPRRPVVCGNSGIDRCALRASAHVTEFRGSRALFRAGEVRIVTALSERQCQSTWRPRVSDGSGRSRSQCFATVQNSSRVRTDDLTPPAPKDPEDAHDSLPAHACIGSTIAHHTSPRQHRPGRHTPSGRGSVGRSRTAKK